MEVKQLDPGLELPSYGARALVPTGLAVAIPEGHAGFVLPRSGLALRSGVTVTNAPGLIDAGYRGELQVILANTDPDTAVEVRRGDRIAQLVVQRVSQVIDGRRGGSLKPTPTGRSKRRGSPRSTPSTWAFPALTHPQPRVWYHSRAPVGEVP